MYMNQSPDPEALSTLLGACLSYGDAYHPERIFSIIIALDLCDASGHIMMVNISASAQRSEDANKIIRRLLMRLSKLGKHLECSFKSYEISHSRIKEISIA